MGATLGAAKPTYRTVGLRETDRLEFFSDAVIAIAMTLLVVDLKVPDPHALKVPLSEYLASQWPGYVAFAASFLFIGIAWAAHHNMFSFISHSNHVLLILNLVFLIAIALQPFSTSLAASYLGTTHERTAVLVYYSVLLMVSFSYNIVWQYARWRGLISHDLDPRLLRGLTWEYAMAPLLHATAIVVALWRVRLSFIPILIIYGFFALPRLSERWPAIAAAAEEK